MLKLLTILSIAVALSSCKPREYRLRDLIDIRTIDSVIIHNNSGDYRLNSTELHAFRNTLGAMHYLPKADLKMGAIGFDIYLKSRGYYIAARTHGQYVKLHRSLIDENNRCVLSIFSPIESEELIFKFHGAVNLDNFRKQPLPSYSAR